MVTIPQWLIELGAILPVPQPEFQQIVAELNNAGVDLFRFGHALMYYLLDPDSTWIAQPVYTPLQQKIMNQHILSLHRKAMAGGITAEEINRKIDAMLADATVAGKPSDSTIAAIAAYRTPETLARHLLSIVESEENQVVRKQALAKLLMHLLREEKLKVPVPA
ncbi:hypothetical protein HY491_02430 [Candidatus Woesearchaeota archaeon]|nr:hypothetical protein [Candidatus Woesearchaeota archaeon]